MTTTEELDTESSRSDLLPLWLIRVIQGLALVLAIALLVAHSLGWSAVHIDGVSIALLVVIAGIPLSGRLRRLKWGEFEAEIGPRTVSRLRATTDELPASSPADDPGPLGVPELIRRDPALGLAKLRLDLEAELRKIVGEIPSGRPSTVGVLAREARRRGLLPEPVLSALNEVVDVANRAIHGAYVSQDTAATIADSGLRLLATLRDFSVWHEEPKGH
jgi:hypothetical protein